MHHVCIHVHLYVCTFNVYILDVLLHEDIRPFPIWPEAPPTVKDRATCVHILRSVTGMATIAGIHAFPLGKSPFFSDRPERCPETLLLRLNV